MRRRGSGEHVLLHPADANRRLFEAQGVDDREVNSSWPTNGQRWRVPDSCMMIAINVRGRRLPA
jgi:hypothetical protein